ncbi:MAG: ComF family protein [Candidatus Kapabacteria bacterium]|nr:ComF family protein [Candidatus Kapabacteria bacterium]
MIQQVKTLFSKIGNAWLEMVAPRHCSICEQWFETVPHGVSEFICNRCLDSLTPAPYPDALLNDLIKHFPGDTLSISNAYSRYLVSPSEERSILNAIHKLKYQGFSRLGTEFGREVGKTVEFFSRETYTAIVPVPIHHARFRERGYNQAELIADGISSVLTLPVWKDVIKRSRYTKTQTTFSATKRTQNVQGAFAPYKNSNRLYNANILVVDDVLTTGSTVNTIGQFLLEHGARRIDVATVAKAM